MYRAFFINNGILSQDKNAIVVRVPQYVMIDKNSFYMIYRIFISDGKLFIRELI
jgi:hypothetical protein